MTAERTMGEGAGSVYLTRRYRFSATHRLYSEALSDAANREIYGKCANDNGHGHNYQVFITMKGTIDPVTGMCCDLDALGCAGGGAGDRPLRHRHLNLDVEDYVDLVPTGENIVRRIWDLLAEAASGSGVRGDQAAGPRLHKVRWWRRATTPSSSPAGRPTRSAAICRNSLSPSGGD